VKVTKVWKGEDKNRPASVAMQLYKDGAAFGVPALLSEANNWTYTWVALEKGPAWNVNEINVPTGYSKGVAGDAANGFVITNTKQPAPPEDGDEVVISGKKTWNHGANPASKWPKEITVIIKSKDIIVAQRLAMPKKWAWSFSLPKYDAAGKEIKYTVDEAQVDGYIKTVDGWNLINTYSPGGEPGEPGQPPDGPNTGDESNLALWLTLMALSLAGLAAVVLLLIKLKKRRKKEEAMFWGLL
jgi:hypothetical protein